MTVPDDGSLAEDGLVPAFIEWSPGPHPSTGQQDLGIRLSKVKLFHPSPDELTRIMKALAIDHLAEVSQG